MICAVSHDLARCMLIAKSDGITPLTRSLDSVIAQFVAAAERCGITEAAKTILEEAKNGN
jgi:hypothetical protein